MGTRLAQELAEFGGDLSLEGLHFWKTAFSAMTHPAASVISSSQGAEASGTNQQQADVDPSSAGDKKVVLLPCKNPPSREHVQLWLKARKQYESIQKERRESGLLKTEGAGLGVEEEDGGPESADLPAAGSCLKVELCRNLSSVRAERRKKQNLSLNLSPLVSTGSQGKSTEASPVSDKGSIHLEKEDKDKKDIDDGDDDDDKTVSPELPTWQQSDQPSPSDLERLSEKKPVQDSPEASPKLCNSPELIRGNHSPSLLSVSGGDERTTSPHLLHSTPFLRRRWRCNNDLDPVCSTPISQGKESSLMCICLR